MDSLYLSSDTVDLSVLDTEGLIGLYKAAKGIDNIPEQVARFHAITEENSKNVVNTTERMSMQRGALVRKGNQIIPIEKSSKSILSKNILSMIYFTCGKLLRAMPTTHTVINNRKPEIQKKPMISQILISQILISQSL